MAIDIKTAGYQKKERVAAPLDAYAGTLNTLQQKHETAIDTSNKIKTILANKNLNEAENKWLSDYSQNINDQIEAAAQDGSYASALTTATKLAGEVSSNAGLIGRERYQQEYKGFQENVKSSKDYDGDVKRFALAMNQYDYKDEVDDKGKVIGGNSFSPNYSPVAQVDWDELYRKALSTVGVDSSSGEKLIWGDDKGNLKEGSLNIGAGDVPYLKTGSGVKKLDSAKIKAAVESAINQTSGARAAIEQDYKVNAWKAKQGEPNMVTRKDGTIMNQEEFEDSLFADRYDSSSYKHISSSIDTSIGFGLLEARRKENTALERERAKSPKSTKSSSPKEAKLVTDFYAPFAVVGVEPDTPSKLNASINSATTNLSNMFAEYKVDKNATTDRAYAELRKRINQDSSITDGVRNIKLEQAKNEYESIQTNTNRLTAINSHLSEEEKQANEFLGKRISKGHMASVENPFQKKYADIQNELFTGENGEVYDRVIVKTASIDRTRKDLAGLGYTSKDIRIDKIDGEEIIYISKDAYTNSAPEITELLTGGQGGKYSISSIGFAKGMAMPKAFKKARDVFNKPVGKKGSLRSVYDLASNMSKRSTEKLESSFPTNFVQMQNFYIPKTITENGQSVTTNLLDDYSEGAMKVLSTADGAALKIMKRDESGRMQIIEDSGERQRIVNNIAKSYIKTKESIIPGWSTDPSSGDYGMTVTLPAISGTSKVNKGREAEAYFIVGAPLNSAISKFSSLPAVKAARTMYSIEYNSALQNGYKLSDSELGDGSYEAFYSKDAQGNPVVTINTGSSEITGSKQEILELIANNHANNASLGSVKSTIEKAQARYGSMSDTPVEEVASVVQGVFNKVMIDAGVTDIESLPVEQRSAVFQRFNAMYRNLTGENLTTEFQNQMLELLN